MITDVYSLCGPHLVMFCIAYIYLDTRDLQCLLIDVGAAPEGGPTSGVKRVVIPPPKFFLSHPHVHRHSNLTSCDTFSPSTKWTSPQLLPEMVRKLKHHEERLLRKVDFLKYKQDGNRSQVIRRFMIQKPEDYDKLNKICGVSRTWTFVGLSFMSIELTS